MWLKDSAHTGQYGTTMGIFLASIPPKNKHSYGYLAKKWYDDLPYKLINDKREEKKIEFLATKLHTYVFESFAGKYFGWLMRFFNINDFAYKEYFVYNVHQSALKASTDSCQLAVRGSYGFPELGAKFPLELNKAEMMAIAMLMGYKGITTLGIASIGDILLNLKDIDYLSVETSPDAYPKHYSASNLFASLFHGKITDAIDLLQKEGGAIQRLEQFSQEKQREKFFDYSHQEGYLMYSRMTLTASHCAEKMQHLLLIADMEKVMYAHLAADEFEGDVDLRTVRAAPLDVGNPVFPEEDPYPTPASAEDGEKPRWIRDKATVALMPKKNGESDDIDDERREWTRPGC